MSEDQIYLVKFNHKLQVKLQQKSSFIFYQPTEQRRDSGT